jgi:hypothetical protein
MARLFKKEWLIRIDEFQFTGLDVEFDIRKNLRREPNCCKLVVFGLAASTRASLEALNLYDPKRIRDTQHARKALKPAGRAPKKGKIRVEIEAGYDGTRSLQFRGDLRRGISEYDGSEVAFEVEGEDGGTSILQSRMNQSYPAGTPRLTVVRDMADALGLGLGNILEVTPLLLGELTHGTAVSGQVSTALQHFLRPLGVTYSVQNGVLQFHVAGGGNLTQAYPLNQNTGLIGYPKRSAHGAIMLQTLMIPNMAPGNYILLTSKRVELNGVYLVKGVETKGSSFGNEWGHTLECYPG